MSTVDSGRAGEEVPGDRAGMSRRSGTARFLVGDVFERMAEIPDRSIDLVLTSPPFLALRSYLPADHPDKAKEIGSEATPADFLDTLLALTAEWRRIIAPHGSIAVELGDTYAGSGGSGGDYNEGGRREGQRRWTSPAQRNGEDLSIAGQARGTVGWPLDKSLCGIPHLYHLSLAYGRNLLTGEPSEAGSWRIRNVVAWCRPNPPVGALGDKYRPGTSFLTIATVAKDRYFDLDAVRVPSDYERAPAARATPPGQKAKGCLDTVNAAGSPPLDWWEIPTQPFAGSHYATWPMALCERPIKSMVPRRVCTTCGEPSRRIVEMSHEPNRNTNGPQSLDRKHLDGGSAGYAKRADRRSSTTGWTDCGHGAWRNGVVLDPFAGSGTTLASATGHGVDAIGIDLDERNADLARQRVGMFLDVDLPHIGAAS